MSESYPPPDAPQECVYCCKAIVLQPGTDRYRSTEHDIAIDRMKCEEAPDRHHKPRDAAAEPPQHLPFNRVALPWVVSGQPEFRTGDLP